jgi:hypothetical protein
VIVPTVGAEGVALIVMALVDVWVTQPDPETVYVIVTEPAATPVTIPVDELTVAFVSSLEDQTPPASPLLVN